jgi:hypothetical protein
MNIIHVSVIVNSLSLLILYVLVYTLFYHNDVKRFNDDILNYNIHGKFNKRCQLQQRIYKRIYKYKK